MSRLIYLSGLVNFNNLGLLKDRVKLNGLVYLMDKNDKVKKFKIVKELVVN